MSDIFSLKEQYIQCALFLLPLLSAFWLGMLGYPIFLIPCAVVFTFAFYSQKQTQKKKQPEDLRLENLDTTTVDHLMTKLPLWVTYPDIEKTAWLNNLIRILWPDVTTFLEKTIQQVAAEQIKIHAPAFLKDHLKIVYANLGTEPLIIEGVKGQVHQDGALLYLNFRLMTVGEKVKVRAKFGPSPFWLAVSDIFAQGTLRVNLRAAPEPPFFETIEICLNELPTIDFAVKVLSVLTLSDFPGFSFVVQSVMNEVVLSPLLVWPNQITLANNKGAIEVVLGKAKIQRYQGGVLNVEMIEARNLKSTELAIFGGKIDPYCALNLTNKLNPKLKSDVKKTKQINGNNNPVWNETLHFTVSDSPQLRLDVEVYDRNDLMTDKRLGQLEFDVTELLKKKEASEEELWLTVVSKAGATVQLKIADAKDVSLIKESAVHLKLKWKPYSDKAEEGKVLDMNEAGILTVTILKAENLVAADIGGTSDPFVVLKVGDDTFKTKVVKKTLNPVWNQTCEFNVKTPKTEVIDMVVFDEDMLVNEEIGRLSLKVESIVTAGGRLNSSFDLTGVKNGTIYLECKWIPLSMTL